MRRQLAKYDFDSSEPGGGHFRISNVALLGGFCAMVIGSAAVITRRSRRAIDQSSDGDGI
jgi:hypothetical protein